jgi:hypothetical protein
MRVKNFFAIVLDGKPRKLQAMHFSSNAIEFSYS